MDGASARLRPLTNRAQPAPDPTEDRRAWRAGREDLREPLGPYVRALVEGGETPTPLEVFRDKPGRRRLARAHLPAGPGCFFKHYPASAGRGLQSLWKRGLGLSPAAREFSLLRRLHAAGVAVPEPLALYRFRAGDLVLVTRLIEGEPLRQALERPHRERRALLEATGVLLARLHAAGFCHRDLHAANVWSTSDGPVLIDLPAALPGAPRWLRRRDLGELDMSLADDLSLADRVRLRAAALSAQRPFSASERAELRAVGRTSHARRQAHLRSRTRRCLRPGRLYAALQVDGARGMRLRECDADRVARALTTPMGDGELSAVHFATGSTWTGGWRRSPAQRAWIAGHGLRARGIGAPRPWAFAEWHRRGRVQRSAVLLDPTRAATPEHTGGAQAWLRAVVELGAALRRDGVDHAGLAAAELRLDPHDALTLTGLEHIRFRRRLPEEACARIDACVAVWLAACAAPPAERAAALKRYVARTRFLPGPPARISRARS